MLFFCWFGSEGRRFRKQRGEISWSCQNSIFVIIYSYLKLICWEVSTRMQRAVELFWVVDFDNKATRLSHHWFRDWQDHICWEIGKSVSKLLSTATKLIVSATQNYFPLDFRCIVLKFVFWFFFGTAFTIFWHSPTGYRSGTTHAKRTAWIPLGQNLSDRWVFIFDLFPTITEELECLL